MEPAGILIFIFRLGSGLGLNYTGIMLINSTNACGGQLSSEERRLRLVVPGLLLFAVIVSGCATVPETGRRSLALLPEGQIDSMAAASFEEMKRDMKTVNSGPEVDMVNRVGRRIVEAARANASHLPVASEWQFVVFDQPDVINAFAMPGGRVGVFTGMFKIVDDDDDLAVVMGHEVAHVAARHGVERVSRQLLVSTGGSVLLGVTGGRTSADTRQIVMAAYGAGTSLGIMLPFSRQDEVEADHIGLLYSSRAGYDPRRAIRFWERMEGESAGSPPEFLSTHPGYDTRIQRLRELMPQAVAEYERARAQSGK